MLINLLITVIIMLVIFAICSFIVQRFVDVDPGLKQLFLLILGAVFLIWILLALAGVAPLWVGHPLR